MRVRRVYRVVWFGVMMSFMLACNLLGSTSTPMAPSLAEPFETPSVGITPSPLAGGTAIQAEVSPGAQTSMPPTPVQGPLIPRLAAGQSIDIMDIHMVDATEGWGIGGPAQARDHVLRTQDGGRSWLDVTPPQAAPGAGEAAAALGFFASASTGWVAYGPTGSSSVPPSVQVWHTQDRGASWTSGSIATTNVSGDSFIPLYLDFVDSQHGWLLVILGGGMMHQYVALYSTGDGGAVWMDILDPNTENGIQSFPKTGLTFLDAQTGWLTRDAQGVDASPHAFLTQDGGVNWTRIDLPAPDGTTGWFDDNFCGTYSPVVFSAQSAVLTMKCLDSATYKVEHDYLYSTRDRGQSWQSVPLPPDFNVPDPPAGGLYFTSSQTGLALSRVIYRTDDGGTTWSIVKRVNWDGQFNFIDLNTGWAVAVNAGQIALVATVDGGATWQELKPVVVP